VGWWGGVGVGGGGWGGLGVGGGGGFGGGGLCEGRRLVRLPLLLLLLLGRLPGLDLLPAELEVR